MSFEELVYLLVPEGCILDVDFTSPESQLDVLEPGNELAEVATKNRLQHLL